MSLNFPLRFRGLPRQSLLLAPSASQQAIPLRKAVTTKPVWLTKRRNSRFHSRTWTPLLPPQPAVMIRRLAWG